MNPGFAVVSGIAVLLGLGCLWIWRKFRREIALMTATETSRAAGVAKLPIGAVVEVKGVVRCDEPLTGEFSGKTCVYFKSEIERKEVRWRDGKRETHYTTEHSSERHAPFEVEDDSGRVPIRAEGASVEAVEVYNESGNTVSQSLLSLATSLLGVGSQDRRFREHILAPDHRVYVFGTVQEGGAIGAAPAGARTKEFIVTYKSEEERTRSSRTLATVLLVVVIALLAIAAAALYAAFLYPVK
ncbi:MAG: hypothetical protein F9K43_02065 [Bauldia sp.]|nr:MAG: hypothetical protein F9K43_02065 [Bauldia sp.]